MARSRRQWSTLKAVIRRKLRETIAAKSYWSDTELLDYWNEAMDLRIMGLDLQHEGWCTQILKADLVANQREYSWPEGAGKLRKVFLIKTTGAVVERFRLDRDEKIDDGYILSNTTATVGVTGWLPTYRMVGELILLEPAPTVSVTQGLELEGDFSAIFFDEDTDKLDLEFPVQLENLLIYDTCEQALAVEAAQGNLPNPESLTRMQRWHQRYEKIFDDWTATRTQGPTYGARHYWGD